MKIKTCILPRNIYSRLVPHTFRVPLYRPPSSPRGLLLCDFANFSFPRIFIYAQDRFYTVRNKTYRDRDFENHFVMNKSGDRLNFYANSFTKSSVLGCVFFARGIQNDNFFSNSFEISATIRNTLFVNIEKKHGLSKIEHLWSAMDARCSILFHSLSPFVTFGAKTRGDFSLNRRARK